MFFIQVILGVGWNVLFVIKVKDETLRPSLFKIKLLLYIQVVYVLRVWLI